MQHLTIATSSGRTPPQAERLGVHGRDDRNRPSRRRDLGVRRQIRRRWCVPAGMILFIATICLLAALGDFRRALHRDRVILPRPDAVRSRADARGAIAPGPRDRAPGTPPVLGGARASARSRDWPDIHGIGAVRESFPPSPPAADAIRPGGSKLPAAA